MVYFDRSYDDQQNEQRIVNRRYLLRLVDLRPRRFLPVPPAKKNIKAFLGERVRFGFLRGKRSSASVYGGASNRTFLRGLPFVVCVCAVAYCGCRKFCCGEYAYAENRQNHPISIARCRRLIYLKRIGFLTGCVSMGKATKTVVVTFLPDNESIRTRFDEISLPSTL